MPPPRARAGPAPPAPPGRLWHRLRWFSGRNGAGFPRLRAVTRPPRAGRWPASAAAYADRTRGRPPGGMHGGRPRPARGGQPTEGRHDGEEHRPARRVPPVPQIAGHRLAHVPGQRERVSPAALAADRDLASPPVEVVEGQAGHVGRAQAQPTVLQEDSVVAAADLGGAVAAVQQRRHRRGVHPGRQPGQPPPGHPRDGRHQVPRHPAAGVQETQHRPGDLRRQDGAASAAAPRLALELPFQDAEHVRAGQPRQHLAQRIAALSRNAAANQV